MQPPLGGDGELWAGVAALAGPELLVLDAVGRVVDHHDELAQVD